MCGCKSFCNCVVNIEKQICNLNVLIPPEVDPEQPPIARINRNRLEASGFHKVKSSRENPVVDVMEITLKKAILIAFSKSYSLTQIKEIPTITATVKLIRK